MNDSEASSPLLSLIVGPKALKCYDTLPGICGLEKNPSQSRRARLVSDYLQKPSDKSRMPNFPFAAGFLARTATPKIKP
jgi:hypothetical protein